MEATRGRPRGFDPEQALRAAMAVFWKHGYEGASMAQLTEATGLAKPSLYAAFGDKESLYGKVVASYGAQLLESQRILLESEPDLGKALDALLRTSATNLTNPDLPGSCLVVVGIADCGGASMPASAARALMETLAASEKLVASRTERARKEGVLAPGLQPAALAGLVSAVLAGMAVQAKAGATRAQLLATARQAKGFWGSGSR